MQGARLLWIRRALQPRRGFWAIPGGFLECGETLAQAASRELFEEAGLEIDAGTLRLHGFGSVKHMNQVYVVYRADVGEVTLRPGEEVLEARFFSESELPWNEIAFPAVSYLVRTTYADMRTGHHGLYLADHDRAVHVDQISAADQR
jgi:ADP-ribose pyrophosphatase YjhB (NUDIX family)